MRRSAGTPPDRIASQCGRARARFVGHEPGRGACLRGRHRRDGWPGAAGSSWHKGPGSWRGGRDAGARRIGGPGPPPATSWRDPAVVVSDPGDRRAGGAAWVDDRQAHAGGARRRRCWRGRPVRRHGPASSEGRVGTRVGRGCGQGFGDRRPADASPAGGQHHGAGLPPRLGCHLPARAGQPARRAGEARGSPVRRAVGIPHPLCRDRLREGAGRRPGRHLHPRRHRCWHRRLAR
jgi:hypothetical protein